MPSRAILVEDLPSIRVSLTAALKDLADVDVVAVAETAEEAISAARHSEWDVMVLDLFLREGPVYLFCLLFSTVPPRSVWWCLPTTRRPTCSSVA